MYPPPGHKQLKHKRKPPRSFQGGRGQTKAPGETYLWINAKLQRNSHAEYLEEIVAELQAQYFRTRSQSERRSLSWEIHTNAMRFLLIRLVEPLWLNMTAFVRRMLS